MTIALLERHSHINEILRVEDTILEKRVLDNPDVAEALNGIFDPSTVKALAELTLANELMVVGGSMHPTATGHEGILAARAAAGPAIHSMLETMPGEEMERIEDTQPLPTLVEPRRFTKQEGQIVLQAMRLVVRHVPHHEAELLPENPDAPKRLLAGQYEPLPLLIEEAADYLLRYSPSWRERMQIRTSRFVNRHLFSRLVRIQQAI
jgi:hypothetical protein